MSRYNDFYPPYVPVAQRRLNGRKELEKLQKKGKVIEPLGKLSHRIKIATSFWGSAWCKHLESFSDFENRLPRGRTYVRNGSVLHLAIDPGTVTAMVQGSSLYEESITIQPLSKERWKAIQRRCQGKIGSLIELLQGKISDEIMTIVTDRQDGLFPKPSEIKLKCSCPDWATMCKHVAAVLYGVGARLDTKPELLFKLRGVDHHDLISAAAATTLDAATKPSGRRRALTSSLNQVFGVEFDATPAVADEPTAYGAAPPRKSAKRTTTKQAAKKAAKTPDPPRKTPRAFKATSASIRKLRTRLGLTRAEFAARVGVSVQSVVNWEGKNGVLNLHASNLERLRAIAAD